MKVNYRGKLYKVYDRRKAFVHELKAEHHENQVKKEELIEKIKLFVDFQSLFTVIFKTANLRFFS